MDFLLEALKDDFEWKSITRDKFTLPKEITLPDIELVDTKRRIGIEVEVENILTRTTHDRALWYTKEDGSLRNHGCEFITVPIKGDEIRYAVWQLMEALPAKADFSERTSIHVHVNVRDFQKVHLLNLILLYIIFEKLLYRFAGPQRYRNIFCVPIQETKLSIAITNFLVNGDVHVLIKEWHKYSGMNLLPIAPQGTIEFRHMEGNRDVMRILRWINLLFSMIKYAREMEFEQLFTTVQRLNSNSYYENFALQVFKKSAQFVMPSSSIKYEMEHGVSTIKAISLPSPFLLSLVKNIHNDSVLLRSLGISDKAVIQKEPVFKVPENAGLQWEAVPGDINIYANPFGWEGR